MTNVSWRRLSKLVLVSLLTGLIGLFSYGTRQVQLVTQAALERRLAEFDQVRAIAAYAKNLDATTAGALTSPLANMTIDGATPAEASAGMLLSLSRHPAAAGVQIWRTAELPAESRGSMVFARQSLEISGTWSALLDFIAAVESHVPVMAVDRLVITASIDNAAGQGSEPTYSAELHLQSATDIDPASTGISPP